MKINIDLVIDGRRIMVQGMIGIFVVILVIWGLVALLNRVTSKKTDEPDGGNG